MIYYSRKTGRKQTMKIKECVANNLKKGALHCAKDSAMARCPWFCYQPKVPAGLKKLKNK